MCLKSSTGATHELQGHPRSLRCQPEGGAETGGRGQLGTAAQGPRGKVSHLRFRADAAFANPDVYKYLEERRITYAIRLPANRILQDRIGYLLKRPVGRPPHHVRRHYANFRYRAASWDASRRVVAKVEWHPGELYPRVGFIVTNMSRPAERVVAFYNKRGTCEQWIKEGKNAVIWTRLSCRSFGARLVSHGRYVAFQMAEVAVPRALFADILRLIAGLRPSPDPAPA